MLEYKGYHAEIEYDKEDDYYCGKLYGIKDLVMFGGATEEEVEADFHLAVEDYLEFCRADGKEPNREFNLELTSSLRTSLEKAAKNAGQSLNNFVEKILTDYLAKTA